MGVSGGGSSLRRSSWGSHVSHTSWWNPVSITPAKRWNPVSFSPNRRNPIHIGPWWTGKSSRKTGSYWPRSKPFINGSRIHRSCYSYFLKSRRGSLLWPRESTLRHMRHWGWGRRLTRKTADHRMLLSRSLHEKCFSWNCGYPGEMSPVQNRYSAHITKRSVSRYYWVWSYCWQSLA